MVVTFCDDNCCAALWPIVRPQNSASVSSEAPADAEMERHIADTRSERGGAQRGAVALEAEGTARDAGLKEGGLAERSAGVGLSTDVPGVEVVLDAA